MSAPAELDADRFLARLREHRSDEERRKIQRYFKSGEGEYGEGDVFIGVRMGTVFALAKEFIDLSPDELERLLDADVHEARAGALRIMADQFRRKKTPDSRRQELYDLYLRRHDRINNWDLVDLAAYHVVGAWLVDRPRDVLYRLARSEILWERRTAMLATMAFIRRGDLEDAFAIAEILLEDEQNLIHKAVGWMLREAGRKDRRRLLEFLDAHAPAMPRIMLTTAMEHFDSELKAHYRRMR